MTIDEKINDIDWQLSAIKMEINSRYGSQIYNNIMYYDKISALKDQRNFLLKQKERKEKLEKIYEGNM